MLLPQSITVTTLNGDVHYFSLFVNIDETYRTCEQLVTMAMKQYVQWNNL